MNWKEQFRENWKRGFIGEGNYKNLEKDVSRII